MPSGYYRKEETADYTYYYNKYDKYHRTDGPAVEYSNGSRVWYVNGKRHRTDGPAIEYNDGSKAWYVDGIQLTEEEFNLRYPPKPIELPKVKSKYKF
jgi:hypothetical protein